ncbi:MAG: molecular chaperone DnaJ [Candidatus Marinimicrobia bacterium]|nr:molecular chaperone DnaJ [Candidatus Neomarinimicrobiota bacterium]
MDKDYYNILGVQKNVSKDDLKKAYHKLARKYHPDKESGDEKKFKEINEAYYVLADEKRRSEYDRYGRVFSGASGGPQDFGGANGFDFSNFGGGFSDFSDVFENLFGFSGAGGTTSKRRGRDISIDMEISFEESIFGTKRKVLLTKPGVCDECQGKGSAPDAVFQKCSQCQGAGKIHETRRSLFGTFTAMRTCSSCEGQGKTPSKKCKKCKGKGVVKKSEEIKMEIPSGIYNGEMIKQIGKGEAVSKGIPGDLYIKVHVKDHPIFKREGFNLTMNMRVPLSEALLGGERKIKTLDGEIKVKIPAGINYGEILRTRNKGVPQENGVRGDLLIKILVELPKNLSAKSKKLIEELKKEGV